jgi:putative acetyltransferase
MRIIEDDLTGAEITALLELHFASMFEHSPPESCHVLPIANLRAPDISFWSAWRGETLLGCGALKEIDKTQGEIKSMRTASEAQGQGVGAAILGVIMETARSRGYHRLSLETGTPEAFAPARRLYERNGFTECPPFGDYVTDPYSVFMMIELAPD